MCTGVLRCVRRKADGAADVERAQKINTHIGETYMPRVELEQLLVSGAHFGHLTRRWNPKMKPYIFMVRNGIHIIDLKKTQSLLEDACNAITRIVGEGKHVLFVGTKKQAQDIIRSEAERCSMNYVTERWLGGMLTNFTTVRRSVRRLQEIEKMEADGTFEGRVKKERLMLSREKEKLLRVLGGVADMTRLPGAVFVVDVKKEHLAVNEARILGIPIFAITDTNVDPDPIDFPIPANDDSIRTIQIITKAVADAVAEGVEINKAHSAEEQAAPESEAKTETPRARGRRRAQNARSETRERE